MTGPLFYLFVVHHRQSCSCRCRSATVGGCAFPSSISLTSAHARAACHHHCTGPTARRRVAPAISCALCPGETRQEDERDRDRQLGPGNVRSGTGGCSYATVQDLPNMTSQGQPGLSYTCESLPKPDSGRAPQARGHFLQHPVSPSTRLDRPGLLPTRDHRPSPTTPGSSPEWSFPPPLRKHSTPARVQQQRELFRGHGPDPACC